VSSARPCTWSTNRPRKALTNDYSTLKTPTQDHQPDQQSSTNDDRPAPAKYTPSTSPLKIQKTKNEELHTHASRSDGPPAAGSTRNQS
jgi:hypothetical protein